MKKNAYIKTGEPFYLENYTILLQSFKDQLTLETCLFFYKIPLLFQKLYNSKLLDIYKAEIKPDINVISNSK